MPSLTAYVAPLVYGAVVATVAYSGYKISQAIQARQHSNYSLNSRLLNSQTEVEEEKNKKSYNLNPFDGPVDDNVCVGDREGNIIPVKEGHWLTGTKDEKWLQEKQPGKTPDGQPTGVRKDGGHPPGPKHSDVRGLLPHAHLPGIANPDGTPWLPIKK